MSILVSFDSGILFAPSNYELSRTNATVSFINQSSSTATFTGFGSNIWTSTSNLSVPANSTRTRTRKSGLSVGDADNISVTISGISQIISVVYPAEPPPPPPPDTTPEPFPVEDMQLTPRSVLNKRFTVMGVNQPINLTVTNTTFTVNGNATEYTSTTVGGGVRIVLKITAPDDYRQSITYTIKGGDAPIQTFVVSTGDPDIQSIVRLNKNAPTDIGLREISTFFGGPAQPSLTDFYRGQSYVPNIAENDNIPVNGSISLTDFYQAATAFYFIKAPAAQVSVGDTTTGAKTGFVLFTLGSDFDMGFGANVRDNSLFKFAINRQDDLPTNALTVALSAGQSINTFSQLNESIRLTTARSYNNEEAIFFGTVTIFAKHPTDGREISIDVSWAINMYGP